MLPLMTRNLKDELAKDGEDSDEQLEDKMAKRPGECPADLNFD